MFTEEEGKDLRGVFTKIFMETDCSKVVYKDDFYIYSGKIPFGAWLVSKMYVESNLMTECGVKFYAY